MKNILTGIVAITLSVIVSHVHAADGKAVYSAACALCHTTGAMAAPKTGDKAAWVVRIKKGMDTLYVNSINGINAMPAKGGKSQFSDAEVKAAVDYMISQSK